MASKIDDEGGELSDINVTPFVDVVLVLLVIFMIATPTLIQNSLKVELPKATSTDASSAKSLGIVVTKGGQILIEGTIASDADLQKRVREEIKTNPEVQALIAADAESQHKDLVHVIDLVKQAGLQKFALEIKHEN